MRADTGRCGAEGQAATASSRINFHAMCVFMPHRATARVGSGLTSRTSLTPHRLIFLQSKLQYFLEFVDYSEQKARKDDQDTESSGNSYTEVIEALTTIQGAIDSVDHCCTFCAFSKKGDWHRGREGGKLVNSNQLEGGWKKLRSATKRAAIVGHMRDDMIKEEAAGSAKHVLNGMRGLTDTVKKRP